VYRLRTCHRAGVGIPLPPAEIVENGPDGWRSIRKLKEGEEVHVVGLADEQDCMSEMFVRIMWKDREFGVPLVQLETAEPDRDTEEAVADWHYWFGDGGRLC
jgi:hypothetical protein